MQKTVAKVTISRGALKREVPKAQWDAMLANKATYGWGLASDIPEDVLSKEAQIKESQESKEVSGLKALNKELEDKIKELSIQISVKDNEIQELKHRLSSGTSSNGQPKEEELTPETKTRAQLEEIAISKGISRESLSKMKTKADIIAAING